MNDSREQEPATPSPSPSAEGSAEEAVLAEMDPGRREFVKRLLITTGATIALITSVSIPEVMASTKASPS